MIVMKSQKGISISAIPTIRNGVQIAILDYKDSKTNHYDKNTINDPVNNSMRKIEGLTSREFQVLEIINSDSEVTRQGIAEQLKCSDGTVKRALAGLVQKGVIERVGSDKTGVWRINK